MIPHPLAELFPMLPDTQVAELARDIKEHGLHEPIMTLDGMVLDGRNRLRACERAGVEPRFVIFDGPDPLAFVASKNLHRRHLDASQRAMIGARIIDMYEREVHDRRQASRAESAHSVDVEIHNSTITKTSATPSIEGVRPSSERVAATMNVGHASVERAKHVLRNAIPEVIAAVESGELPVSRAAKIAKQPENAQRLAMLPPLETPPGPHPNVLLAAELEKAIDALQAVALKCALSASFSEYLLDLKMAAHGTWFAAFMKSYKRRHLRPVP